MCTGDKAWVWTNKDGVVTYGFAPGTILDEIIPLLGIGQLIELTPENTPVANGDIYDGEKFIKRGQNA